ncbi:hypothetical protein ZIOFF_019713 [Zingiber officinale]|uniref:Uncharacterized protein n=1 Tax=Zingiber officinale TaxID=94328 RepID=A0A8J5HS99_ZINOF|nr:hypothetical protein ZIOFF_019713 [Zingiber officinale]
MRKSIALAPSVHHRLRLFSTDHWSPSGDFSSPRVADPALVDLWLRGLTATITSRALRERYQIWLEGLVKILKKYDKRTGALIRQPFIEKVLQQPFFTTDLLYKLVKECGYVQPPLPQQQPVNFSRMRQTKWSAKAGTISLLQIKFRDAAIPRTQDTQNPAKKARKSVPSDEEQREGEWRKAKTRGIGHKANYTVAQAYAGFLGVDAVEDALVSDLALGGQAYEAPDVGVR